MFVDTGERKPEKKKPAEKEVTLKDIFMGGALDGFIEAAKSISLDDFAQILPEKEKKK